MSCLRSSRRPAFAGLFALGVVASCGGAGGETASFESGVTGSGNITGDATAAGLYDATYTVHTDAQDLLSLGDGASRGVGPGQACQVDSDCGPGGLCDPIAHACGCGGTLVHASSVPPNLLVALDRSCSMQAKVNGTAKWTIAIRALMRLTQSYAGRIRFGLTLFPDRTSPNKCTEGAIPIDVGPGNEGPIQTLLAASLTLGDPNYPNGPCVTPIDAAMTQVQADTALADKTRGDFALLITDGMQAGCNAQNGNNVTIQALTALASAGVRTFVVGFGSSVSVASLDSFAQTGGAVNPAGPHQFYDAADQASLEGALGAIAQATLSCVLQLSQPPPNGDPSSIFVYFDKMPPPVTRDPTRQNGWDYDPLANTVTFYGSACDALKRGTVSAAEVIFGCGGGAVPPPI